MQELFRTHTFQVAFSNFRQESSLLALLMVEKGQGLFFIFEKKQGAFLTSKKGQGLFFIFEKRQGAFLISERGQGGILTFKRRQGTFLTFKKKGRVQHPLENVKHEH